MKRDKTAGNKKLRVAIKRAEEELRIVAKILESIIPYSAEWDYYADKIAKGERWTRGWT